MVKKKALILILSYNAEKKILSVLDRIPDKVFDNDLYETDILILDDASHDLTYNKVVESNHRLKGRITIYRHPVNLGYGGNQKSGYRYAIDNGYDAVVLLHGDGQYAPEMLHDMLEPVVKGEAEALFGSRMKKLSGALKGGMPLYKFVGNIILSRTQNFLLGANLSEFHSGYRTYSVQALDKIRFECNSDWFDFDTDIIIQLLMNGFRIKEIEIPTYYGDEVCHVNGMKYAFMVIYNTVVSRLCLKNLMYVRKYDPPAKKHTYVDKTSFSSSQQFALSNIPMGSKVLDLGCGEGYVSREAKRKGCEVIGVDWKKPENIDFAFNKFIESDIETLDLKQFTESGLTHISMLDVIEHLKSPEKFLDNLREAIGLNVNTNIIITTPNIAFFSMRLALLLGNFSYRKAGIMDMTHTRLFTFSSLVHTLKTAGFKVDRVKGIPAPFPLVLGKNPLSKFMLKVNMLLIYLWKSMFAYQIAVIARPTPTARQNLTLAIRMSEKG